MAKGTKTGGRAKGTPNKASYDVHKLLDRVFAKKGGIDLAEKLNALLNLPMDRGVEARVLLKLMEYRYGAPRQEVSGPDGGPMELRIIVEHIGQRITYSTSAKTV